MNTDLPLIHQLNHLIANLEPALLLGGGLAIGGLLVALLSGALARLAMIGLALGVGGWAAFTPSGQQLVTDLLEPRPAAQAQADQRPPSPRTSWASQSVPTSSNRPSQATAQAHAHSADRQQPTSPGALDDLATLGRGNLRNARTAYDFIRQDDLEASIRSVDFDQFESDIQTNGEAARRTLDRIENTTERIGNLLR